MKWTWMVSALSTNESSQIAMVMGLQSCVWSGPLFLCKFLRVKNFVKHIQCPPELLNLWVRPPKIQVVNSWLTWLPICSFGRSTSPSAPRVLFFPPALASQKSTPPRSPIYRPITEEVKTAHTYHPRTVRSIILGKICKRCHVASLRCPPLAPAIRSRRAMSLARLGHLFARSINPIGPPTYQLRWAAWRIFVFSKKIEPETVKFGRFGLVSGLGWSSIARTVTAVRVREWSHEWCRRDGGSDWDFLVAGSIWGLLVIARRGRKPSSSRSRWLWQASWRPCRRDRWVNSADCCGLWSCVSSCSSLVLWKVCVQNWG